MTGCGMTADAAHAESPQSKPNPAAAKPVNIPPPPAATTAPPKKIEIDPNADPKAVVDQALKAYESGHYGDAAALLAADLQNHPSDGQVHYYLGLALKKQGYDMPALNELEKAARLCPPAMIKRFADEQIGNLDEPETLGGDKKENVRPSSAPQGDWLSNITNGFNQMFGGKPATPTSSTTGSGATTGAAGNSTANNSFGAFTFPAMPDLMGQMKDAIKQGKKMLRQGKNATVAAVQNGGGSDYSLRHAGEADIMHMADMQALVDKSHSMNVPEWASGPTGLVAYEQAPEETPEWNYWIGRFKRCFQHVLLRRLNAESHGEERGAASCIFSLDRDGNLRGQVYASTADPVLNKCLVESVRDLNHSRILKFPATSRITGWNFKMSWNFKRYLAIVKSHREELKREELVQALLKIVKEDAAIKAQIKAGEEKRARALAMKKLAAEKALKARLKVVPPPVAKAEVSGQIVTKMPDASPRELRAVALELKDLTPVTSDTARPDEDPFARIDDSTINRWPDLNP